MRAVVMDGPGDWLVEDVEPMAPQGDQVVVRTGVGLACITDAIQRVDGGGLSEAHVRGHAGVGEVVAVGPDVTRVHVGQRVVAPTRPMCERCFWCLAGQPEQCEASAAPGPVVARRADGTELRGSARVGSFAEQMLVREVQLVPVDSTISDFELVSLACGGGGGLGAMLNVATIAPGATALVLGAGVFGLSGVQGARIAGAQQVVVVEPLAERRALALKLGATHVIDPADGDVGSALAEITQGRGACVTLEAVSGGEHYRTAFDLTRRGGQVVLGGFGAKAAKVQFPANDLGMRGKQLLSCQFGSTNIRRDIPAWAKLIESGDYDAASLVPARYSLDEINTALDDQQANRILGACIVPG